MRERERERERCIPAEERTHLESPALATVRVFSLSRQTTAVVPLWYPSSSILLLEGRREGERE